MKHLHHCDETELQWSSGAAISISDRGGNQTSWPSQQGKQTFLQPGFCNVHAFTQKEGLLWQACQMLADVVAGVCRLARNDASQLFGGIEAAADPQLWAPDC